DTLENMSTINNTVYYVVGTKDELEQKGVIQEEGGARFLFVLWKSGKTLVPARNLDPGAFTVADRRHFTELPLPAADKEYRIVSRQDSTRCVADSVRPRLSRIRGEYGRYGTPRGRGTCDAPEPAARTDQARGAHARSNQAVSGAVGHRGAGGSLCGEGVPAHPARHS